MSDPTPREASADDRANLEDLLSSNAISIPIEVRVGGAARIVLGRGLLTGPEILVFDVSGRIPTFATARAAVAWGERALPRPADGEEARFAQIMSQAFTDRQYRQFFRFDLDRWLAWARQPRIDEITPTSLVDIWNFVALSGELPPAPRGDPTTIHEPLGERGRGVHNLTDAERVTYAMSKADLLHTLAGRQRRPEDRVEMPTWPAGMWDDDDTRRVARALERALTAFVARLTDDADAVERALTEAR